MRPRVFDSAKFKTGHDEYYSTSYMDRELGKYQRHLVTNFDAKRGQALRKLEEETKTRSATMDLDLNMAAFEMTTTNKRDLSRYILEDVLSCKQGERFVVLIAKDANDSSWFGGDPKKVAAIQKKEKIGGM